MHSTIMRGDVVAAAAGYLYPMLEKTEDADSFAATAGIEMRSVAADAIAACIERFDAEFRARAPRGWELRGAPARTVITLAGAITYRRALYRDEYGRNRYPADELLGMPKRARVATDAFLWMCRRAASASYRKTASDFSGISGVPVSPMLPWRCVQREADLIRAEMEGAAPEGGVSQADVYAECDGLFLALQTPSRRAEAIDRFLYEQSRSKSSFEMKCGCVYAGKADKGGRTVRGNVALFATTGSARDFWDGMRRTVEADYDVADIETLHASSDAGGWCRNLGIGDMAGNVVQGLDAFHVMKLVVKAFPEGAGRERLVSLALKRRPEAFAEMCDRVLPQVRSESRRDRIRRCGSYVRDNADLLRGGGSLGTMEATNAYAWAKRMKSCGISWSRRGAESMALVLCRTAAKRPLIAPPKDAFFTGPEAGRREAAVEEAGRAAARQEAAGSGWWPITAHTPLEKAPGAYAPVAFLDLRVV